MPGRDSEKSRKPETTKARATRTETARRTDLSLMAVSAFVEELVEIADEWEELTDLERASLAMDWSNLVGHLEALDLSYAADKFTEAQERRYEVLRARLESPDIFGAIERLRFRKPSPREQS